MIQRGPRHYREPVLLSVSIHGSFELCSPHGPWQELRVKHMVTDSAAGHVMHDGKLSGGRADVKTQGGIKHAPLPKAETPDRRLPRLCQAPLNSRHFHSLQLRTIKMICDRAQTPERSTKDPNVFNRLQCRRLHVVYGPRPSRVLEISIAVNCKVLLPLRDRLQDHHRNGLIQSLPFQILFNRGSPEKKKKKKRPLKPGQPIVYPTRDSLI